MRLHCCDVECDDDHPGGRMIRILSMLNHWLAARNHRLERRIDERAREINAQLRDYWG